VTLPHDVRGDDIARALRPPGYEISRQSGSHMRLTTHHGGEHPVTVPRHSALRVGPLVAILNDVADRLGVERDDLAERLFG